MKRIITTCLAIAMLLTSIGFSVNADTSNANKTENTATELELSVREAVCVLKSLNIIDESYDATKTSHVTRAEFAGYIVKALKIENVDVPVQFSDTQNCKAVNILAYAGYIKADKNSAYKPNDAVTFGEALTIIMRALGYGQIIDINAGNYNKNISLARRLNLIERAESDSPISYGKAACLVYNMLGCAFSDEGIYFDEQPIVYDGGTLFEKIYRAQRIEGVVVANEFTSLYMDIKPLEEKMIQIGDTAYNYSLEVDASELLGRKVFAFVQDNDRKAKDIIALVVDDTDEAVVELRADEICGVKDGEITYLNKNKNETRISYKNPVVIYNGNTDYTISEHKLTEIVKMIISTGRGDVRVCTNNSIRDVVYVNVVENIEVTDFDKSNSLLYGSPIGGTGLICVPLDEQSAPISGYTEAAKYVNIIDSVGINLDKGDISIGDLLSVIISPDGSHVKIVKCTKKALGTIKTIQSNGKDTSALIEDKTYIFDRAYASVTDIKQGGKGTFILDIYDKIIGTQGKVVYDGKQLGYLYAIDIDGSFNKTVMLKVYNEFGSDDTLTLRKKITLDGANVDAEAAYTALRPGGELKKQGILYKVNDAGQITYIDTAAPNSDGSEGLKIVGLRGQRTFSCGTNIGVDVGSKKYQAKDNEDVYMGLTLGFPVSDETKYFRLVCDSTGYVKAENSQATDYSGTTSTLNESNYEVELYKIDEKSPFVDFVVEFRDVESVFAPAQQVYPLMINEVYTTLNTEGEAVGIFTCISPLLSHSTYEIKARPSVRLYINGLEMDVDSAELFRYIGEGDVIMIDNDDLRENICCSVRVVYDSSEDMIEYGWKDLWKDGSNYNTVNTGYGFDASEYTDFTGTYQDYLNYLSNAKADNTVYDYKCETESAVKYKIGARFMYGEVEDIYIEDEKRFVMTIADMTPGSTYKDLRFKPEMSTQRYPTYDANKKEYENAYFAPIFDIVSSKIAGVGKGDRVIVYQQGEGSDAYFFYKTEK